MGFLKTNSIDIEVDGVVYNSLTDLGLAIENTNYIGNPVQPGNYTVLVPGRNGPLDLTDSVFGGQYFQYRSITVNFGAMQAPEDWDAYISQIRNLFEGKRVKLTFATDPNWYWTGRAAITNFQHQRNLGTFTFYIQYADPCKYSNITKAYEIEASASGTSQVCVNNYRFKIVPTFTAEEACTLTFGSITKDLVAGDNTFSDIAFAEGENEIIVTGSGTVTVTYTEKSL